MARPRSEQKQSAILKAAAERIAEVGLGAATAQIAERASVPHGSVFTYFPTKEVLFNAVYVELKAELTEAVLAQMPAGDDTRAKLRHLWTTWTHWGVANPVKRRALAQLEVSEAVTAQSRKRAYEIAAPSLAIVRNASAQGVLGSAPPDYVAALVEAAASTTMDYMARDAVHADAICNAGFEALWKAVS